MAGPRNVRPATQVAGRSVVTDLEQRLAAGAPERVGWFCFYFDEQRWEWSPQVQRMHGYEPGTVTPTMELVLAHKHPDDVRQIADTLALIRQTRQPFSSRHRIRDVNGGVHHVLVVGQERRDDAGDIVGTHGFYIDLTPEELARQDQVSAAVARIAAQRAVIEQAKGMLMLAYGIDASRAFELLRHQSQQTKSNCSELPSKSSPTSRRCHTPTLSPRAPCMTRHC